MAKDFIKCHATSSFSIEGEHVENGSNLEVSEEIYKQLRAAQRVEDGHVEAPKSKSKGKGEGETGETKPGETKPPAA